MYLVVNQHLSSPLVQKSTFSTCESFAKFTICCPYYICLQRNMKQETIKVDYNQAHVVTSNEYFDIL